MGRISGDVRSRILLPLSIILTLFNLLLAHQLHELKRHLRSLPWHPSPTGVFDLLERSRAWKNVQEMERPTEMRARFLWDRASRRLSGGSS